VLGNFKVGAFDDPKREKECLNSTLPIQSGTQFGEYRKLRPHEEYCKVSLRPKKGKFPFHTLELENYSSRFCLFKGGGTIQKWPSEPQRSLL
jgi:hypothetical protein